MEILSFLHQNNMQGEILHGSAEYIARRLETQAKVSETKRKLNGARYGIVGEPSDWLISSVADSKAVKAKLGIELVASRGDRYGVRYAFQSAYSLSNSGTFVWGIGL